MAAAVVQSSSSVAGGYPSASASFSSLPTVGNVVFVTGVWNPSFGTEPTGVTVSDNQGNTYSTTTHRVVTQENGVFIARAVVGTSSGTFTVTATVTGGSADAGVGLRLIEVSGMDNSDLLDQTGTGQQFLSGGSDFTVTASGANTGADRLVIAVVSGRGDDITPTNSPPSSGYTNSLALSSGGFGEPRGLSAYKIVTSSETSSANWGTISGGSGSGSLVIATFKVASGTDPNAAQDETISFSDAQTGVAKFIGLSAESITFADSQAATADFISAQAETITLSDSQVAASNSDAAQDETLTLSDSQVATGGSDAEQAETLTLSDSAIAVQASANAQAETITLSDSAVAVAAFDGLQDESITLVDEQEATDPGESAQDETITFLDSQVAVQDSACAQGESITFVDVVSAAGDDPIIDTHDGFWVREWKKMVEREKKLTVEEVMEIVEEAPKEVLDAIPEVKKQVKKEYGRVDYQRIANNLQMQRFIAEQILERHQQRMQELEEDDLEVLLLL